MEKKAMTGGLDFFLYVVIMGLIGLVVFLVIFGNQWGTSIGLYSNTVGAYDAEDLLEKGTREYDDEYFSDAAEYYKLLIEKNPFDKLIREGHLMLALSYGADERRHTKAVRTLEIVKERFLSGNSAEIDALIESLKADKRNDAWRCCNLGNVFGSRKVYGICPDSLSSESLIGCGKVVANPSEQEDINNLPRTAQEILDSITDEDKERCGYSKYGSCSGKIYCPCVEKTEYDSFFEKYVNNFEDSLNDHETTIAAHCVLSDLATWRDSFFLSIFNKINIEDEEKFNEAFEKCIKLILSNSFKGSKPIEISKVKILCNKYKKYSKYDIQLTCIKKNNEEKRRYANCLLDMKGLDYNDYEILRNIKAD
jgi:uncharacterized membrane protein